MALHNLDPAQTIKQGVLGITKYDDVKKRHTFMNIQKMRLVAELLGTIPHELNEGGPATTLSEPGKSYTGARRIDNVIDIRVFRESRLNQAWRKK